MGLIRGVRCARSTESLTTPCKIRWLGKFTSGLQTRRRTSPSSVSSTPSTRPSRGGCRRPVQGLSASAPWHLWASFQSVLEGCPISPSCRDGGCDFPVQLMRFPIANTCTGLQCIYEHFNCIFCSRILKYIRPEWNSSFGQFCDPGQLRKGRSRDHAFARIARFVHRSPPSQDPPPYRGLCRNGQGTSSP
jgi:hypothetical protein